MKKTLLLLLAMVFAIALVGGCAGGQDADVVDDPVVDENPAEEPNTDEESTVVADAAMGYFANLPDSKHMANAEDIVARLANGEELFILDVRQPDAYAEGHLKGAINVPYGPDIAAALEQLPDDVEIFVNCYTGQTSSQTVAILNMAGKFATNIQKGFNNGISQVEGVDAVLVTEATELPEGNYPVDDELEAAIADYYAEAVANTFSLYNISVDSVKELVDAESTDYTILSVRTAEDYAAGHVKGAINIPFGAGMQEQFATMIPADKPVIVYCYTGQTASQTVAVLRMLGYEAYNMSQGMINGWLPAGYEVVTD